MNVGTLIFSFILVVATSAWAGTDPSCQALKRAKSKESKTSLKIKFVNRTDDLVHLIWLGFAGDKKKYAEIDSLETFEQETFLTHPWLVQNSKGECLGIFLPDPAKTEIVIK